MKRVLLPRDVGMLYAGNGQRVDVDVMAGVACMDPVFDPGRPPPPGETPFSRPVPTERASSGSRLKEPEKEIEIKKRCPIQI